jgi:hypothetical protein
VINAAIRGGVFIFIVAALQTAKESTPKLSSLCG